MFAAVAWHGWTKWQTGITLELFWICHVTSLLIAVGLFGRSTSLLATGFVLYLGAGIPPWLIDVAFTGQTTASSVTTHLVSPLCAGLALRGQRWPKAVIGYGFVFYLCTLVTGYLLTPPALNVNLVFAPYFDVFSLWTSRILTALTCLTSLVIAEFIARRWLHE